MLVCVSFALNSILGFKNRLKALKRILYMRLVKRDVILQIVSPVSLLLV